MLEKNAKEAKDAEKPDAPPPSKDDEKK